MALEAEQAGWERHFDQAIPDLNPAVALVERLTVDQWEKHLASQAAEETHHRAAVRRRD